MKQIVATFACAASFAILLAGCEKAPGPETAGATPEPTQSLAGEGAPSDTAIAGSVPAPTPKQATRTVDWDAARVAKVEAAKAGRSSGVVGVESLGVGSPVPVMLPAGIVMPQNARPSFGTMEDGYFASYPGPKYDIIVNGTNQVYDTPAMDASEADLSTMTFTATEAGAQVAFSRFGADYLVEFECKVLDSEDNCITEEEALKVADGLFVAVSE